MNVKLLAFFSAGLLALPAAAQTAAELLQKGIYSQDTAGDLDAAIQVYRQIVNSAFPQRDIAAQAQYRLVQALLQKGDLAGASTEMGKLSRDYADWAPLLKNLARNQVVHSGPPPGSLPPQAQAVNAVSRDLVGMEVDLSRPLTVRGKVIRAIWANPRMSVAVEGKDDSGNTATWSFITAAPNTLIKKGIRKDVVRLGDEVTITGWLAKDAKPMTDGSLPAFTDVMTSAEGKQLYNRAEVLAQ